MGEALTTLAELNRLRNARPVAETIGRLLEATRAHVGFVLWRGGEQVLANVLQIAELARRYEADGGLSFRGFVDELREAADRAPTPEAPILEEGTDGVRLMTVHKAKGLEFPVVILADIGCKLSRDDAQRYLDSSRGLAAIKLAGWAPLDLREHNDLEASRDKAEGVRLAYVAATRARDLLVVPAIGDGPDDKHWVQPLAAAIYGGDAVTAVGVPAFTGKDTHLDRPPSNMPTLHTMRPGAYGHVDPTTGESYTVAWWDPLALDRPGAERRGLRHEHLIHKDAPADVVAADRAAYDAWRAWRTSVLDRGAASSRRTMTATEWADASLDGAVVTPPDVAARAARVTVVDAGLPGDPRPSGRRYAPVHALLVARPARRHDRDHRAHGHRAGPPVERLGRRTGRRGGTWLHALLAHVPLDASVEAIARMAAMQARMLNASDDERAFAAEAAERALAHDVFVRARAAVAAGRACQREMPLAAMAGGVLVDGQADLAFDDGASWVVVDFKSDVAIASAEPGYRLQVAFYANAVSRAYDRPVEALLLRV